jgi:hypothetical protein
MSLTPWTTSIMQSSMETGVCACACTHCSSWSPLLRCSAVLPPSAAPVSRSPNATVIHKAQHTNAYSYIHYLYSHYDSSYTHYRYSHYDSSSTLYRYSHNYSHYCQCHHTTSPWLFSRAHTPPGHVPSWVNYTKCKPALSCTRSTRNCLSSQSLAMTCACCICVGGLYYPSSLYIVLPTPFLSSPLPTPSLSPTRMLKFE